MSEGSMRGDGVPTRADVEEAMRAWSGLGNFDPIGDERADRTYSDGRIVIRAPSPEAGRRVEETARAREERHRERRTGLMRAMGEALARGYAVRPGPWTTRNCGTEKGREDLRRAGFEERHNGELGTVWVRPEDGKTLKPGENPLVVPVELDLRGGRSG